MKTIKNFSIFVFFLNILPLMAQYTGVGVTNPNFNLDVSGSFRIQNQNVNTTAGIWFDGSLNMPTRSFVGSFNDTYFGLYGNGGVGWNLLINNSNHNVGIGGIIPDYRLDINGRMRLAYDGSSAGIWFDGTSLPIRSFIGNMDDNYIGIWGGGGASWNFVMNVANKNIGIGTTAPTSGLDLNGSFRLRSNAPVKGSLLASQDVNGNAEWVNPVVFKAEGTLNNVEQPCPNTTWTKVLFNQSPVYNISAAYQPNSSVFVVPANGIYGFNTSVAFRSFANNRQSIRIVLRRNGVNQTLAQAYNKGIYRTSDEGHFSEQVQLGFEYQLLVGDQIWVEVWMDNFNDNSDSISPGITSTWFSGNLISKL